MSPRQFNLPGFERLLQLAFVVLLVLASLRIVWPFMGALVWGGIIAISLWPLFLKLRDGWGWRAGRAATALIILLSLTLIVPLGLAALSLSKGVPELSALMHGFGHGPAEPAPGWLSGLPLIGSNLAELWQTAQTDLGSLVPRFKPLLDKAALWALANGAALGFSILEMALAMLLAGVLLAWGDESRQWSQRLIEKLGGQNAGSELPQLVASTVRSVTNGVVGTALVQTLLATIGYAVCGLPAVAVLSILTFVLALAQLPTLLIWAPAAGWLFYSGDTGYGTFLALWGLLLVNTIDNVLKPVLISRGLNMPMALILLGVIGGLLAWGMIGLFIGPTVLAVGYSLLCHWLREPQPAPAAPANIDNA